MSGSCLPPELTQKPVHPAGDLGQAETDDDRNQDDQIIEGFHEAPKRAWQLALTFAMVP